MTTPADQPDLLAWLRAQLDEDERVAQEASAGPWRVGSIAYDLGIADVESAHGNVTSAYSEPCCAIPDAEHIARHGPARVLAEVDAKRRILDLVASTELDPLDESDRTHRTDLDAVLRLLALPYADRDGYRDEWRPA